MSMCFLLLVASAEDPPKMPHPRYYSEVWRGGPYDAPYPQESKPDTGLFAYVDLEPNEPVPGYPYHSGIVEGLSDTISLSVHFRNRNQSDYDISSYQPDNWFIPVIYDVNADPWKSQPLPEPSSFGYSFLYWENWFDDIVSQPSVIPYSGEGNTRYHLVYYVWGIPSGRFRVMMKKTENAPADFRLLLKNVPSVWITKPQFLGDTINAFTACFWRSYYHREYNIALGWVDSIFKYNPFSIVGYFLQTAAYARKVDSLHMAISFDSTIAILERYGDPALPDSADMDRYHRMWYKDRLNQAEVGKWQLINRKGGVYW